MIDTRQEEFSKDLPVIFYAKNFLKGKPVKGVGESSPTHPVKQTVCLAASPHLEQRAAAVRTVLLRLQLRVTQ